MYLSDKIFSSFHRFIEKQYHLRRLSKTLTKLTETENPIIFDVGGNEGESIDFFSNLFENPTIYSFEPEMESYQELVKKYGNNKGGILPQFLPKRAWYFGGAGEVDLFCHLNDKEFFSYFPDGICLDTAHLVMACNSAKGNQKEWFRELLPFTGHLHIFY